MEAAGFNVTDTLAALSELREERQRAAKEPKDPYAYPDTDANYEDAGVDSHAQEDQGREEEEQGQEDEEDWEVDPAAYLDDAGAEAKALELVPPPAEKEQRDDEGYELPELGLL